MNLGHDERTAEMTARGGGGELPPSSMIALAACLGLTGGWAELAELAVQRWVLGEVLYVSRHVLWVVPVTYLLLAVLVGGAMGTLRHMLPRTVTQRATLRSIAFVIWCCVLLVWHPRIHLVAILLLAAGLTHPTTELISRWRSSRRWRPVPVTVGAVALLLLGPAATWALQSQSDAARPSTTPAGGDADNVVLVVWDTVRKISVGDVAGTTTTSLTPNLDRLATRGAAFTDAVSPSPWTLPAHASLFTGHWPLETSAGWRTPLDDELPTVAEVLTSEGYATGGFVANLIYGTRVHGLSRGFTKWEDYRLSWGEVVLSTALGRLLGNSAAVRRLTGYRDILGRRSASDITDAFLHWQSGLDRPFFAFLNYFDAHEPYLPPAPYDTLIQHVEARRNDLIRLWDREGTVVGKERMTEEEMEVEISAYRASISYLDAQLGRLMDSLDARGVLSRTLIIVTSDHGEQFGERGRFTHGNSLYPEATEVPLVVAGSGVTPGVRVSEPVSLRNIPATMLAALTPLRSGDLPGTPLQSHWVADSAVPGIAISQLRDDGVSDPWNGATSSVTTATHLLVENGDSSIELFQRESGIVTRRVPADESVVLGVQLQRQRDSILAASAADPVRR